MIWGVLSVLSGCSKDDSGVDEEDPKLASLTVQKVNTFIMSYMLDGYLWNDKIPANINIFYETNPFTLFDKIKYKDDQWSLLTDDIDGLNGSISGVNTTFGYSLAFNKFTNTDSYFAVVCFVYPETPADKAGVKRGDILMRMNGKEITADNYTDLFYTSSIELQYGELTGNQVRLTDKIISLTAVKMYEDPVNAFRIIKQDNHKVGYLAYTDYVEDSYSKLSEVFEEFKKENITDLVLDLRYNSGGSSDITCALSSMLVSESVTKNKNIFLKEIWNSDYMSYFEATGLDMNTYFDSTVPVNLNLKRVYILTTSSSASASEATIIGLSPYMEVIQIGEVTAGKYCGGGLFRPVYIVNGQEKLEEEIKNWGMYMMLFRYTNRDGITDFKKGLTPQYMVEDDLLAAYPFGDTRDPLLARAMELITGQPPVTTLHQPTKFSGKFLSGLKSRTNLLEGKMIQKTEKLKK